MARQNVNEHQEEERVCVVSSLGLEPSGARARAESACCFPAYLCPSRPVLGVVPLVYWGTKRLGSLNSGPTAVYVRVAWRPVVVRVVFWVCFWSLRESLYAQRSEWSEGQ